jgi:hypothetical protein
MESMWAHAVVHNDKHEGEGQRSKLMHAMKAVDKVRWTREGVAVMWNTFFILDLGRHTVEGIRGLDFEGDGLAAKSSRKSACLHADGEW